MMDLSIVVLLAVIASIAGTLLLVAVKHDREHFHDDTENQVGGTL